VIIGEDEMSSGEYQLKDMLESKQYKGTIEQLAQIVLGKKQARQGVLKRD